MSLSDCEKCWETPCVCGHNYKDWSATQLAEQIQMLTKLRDDKIHKWNSPKVKWPDQSFIVLRYSYKHIPDKFVLANLRDPLNQYRSFWTTVPNFRGGYMDCGLCEWFERSMQYANVDKWRYMTEDEKTEFMCKLYRFNRKKAN